MKTKFILPAGLVLTLHAFLLFGLPGKAPVTPPAPDPPRPEESTLTLDQDDPVGVARNEDDPPPEPGGPVAPRRPEIPVSAPREDVFFIPALPPMPGSPTVKTIPAGWERPRDPGNGINLRVVDGVDLDRAPRARLQPPPDYPYSMRSRGVEGMVVVEFLVDEAGNVYRTALLRATNPGFEEAALRAVARWKFEPGSKNGRKVRFRMSVPLVFRIDAG